MSAPRITARVLSRLTASLLAEATVDHVRGDLSPGSFRAMKRELDDLDALKRRGRIPAEHEKFHEWVVRRHQSLSTSGETRAVERMLRRLVALANAYAAGYEDGRREERGEERPTVLAAEAEREKDIAS
jgi:hypothetical protein